MRMIGYSNSDSIILYYTLKYIYTYYFILKFDLDFLQLTLQNVNMILLTVASLG